ncbi:unnamed protein product [Xylocopa violacea]|uniref:Uncharacterized protein n=1 Tax=Xylocopa violacea TaxID=135666 RepID=A0ABP1P4Q3_XYLVO
MQGLWFRDAPRPLKPSSPGFSGSKSYKAVQQGCLVIGVLAGDLLGDETNNKVYAVFRKINYQILLQITVFIKLKESKVFYRMQKVAHTKASRTNPTPCKIYHWQIVAGFRLEIARAASVSHPHESETRLDLPLHCVRRTDIQVCESIHTEQSYNSVIKVLEMSLKELFHK